MARASTGGMRDAQSLLDQLITLGGGEAKPEDLTSLLGTVTGRRMEDLLRGVAKGDDAGALLIFAEAFDRGVDAAEFLKQLIETVRDLLVLLTCGADTDLVDQTPDARVALAEIAKEWGKPRVLFAIGLLSETLKTVKAVGEGRALVELALARIGGLGRLRTLDEVLKDFEDLSGGSPRGGSEVARPPAPAQRLAAPPPVVRESPPAVPGAPGTPPAAPPAREPPAPGGPALFKDAAVPEGALRGEESDGLTIEKVRAGFEAVLARVTERSSATASFLLSGRVLGLEGRAVVIAFPPAARFQKAQLDDLDRLRIVEQSMAEVFGTALKLKTTVSEASAEMVAPAGAPGAPAEAGAVVGREEIEKIKRTPVIEMLTNLFGVRLVHVERT